MSEENNNNSNNEKENRKKEAKTSDAAKKSSATGKEKRVLIKKDSEKTAGKKDKDKASWLGELKRYLRGVVSEVKKVHWLGTKELVIYTIVVFVAVLFVGSLIWLFDSLLTTVLRLVI